MSDLPRLLLCSFDVLPAPTGTSRRLLALLPTLTRHFQVTVLSLKTPEHTHIEKIEGARVLRVPVADGDQDARLEAFDRAVRRQLDSEDYVLAHVTDPFAGAVLAEARTGHSFRLVYDALSFPSVELPARDPGASSDPKVVARIRRLELHCLMSADRVIAASEVTRGYVRSLGVPDAQIELLRPPVPGMDLPNARESDPTGRPFRIVYVGSDAPWQGVPTLLRAVAIASSTVDVSLDAIGPSRAETFATILASGDLASRVNFRPPEAHAELTSALATYDAGALPLEDVDRNRLLGGACSKAAEYLSAGLPVIASDVPLARDVVPAEAAVFHRPGDADGLAAAILAIHGAPERRARMAAVARDEARKRHDADAIARRLLEIYEATTGTSLRQALAATVASGSESSHAAHGPTPPPSSEHEVAEVDPADVVTLDETHPQPLARSNLDPWFAQLVHGYCPPEGAAFDRPTPPTTFPGREEPPRG